MTDTDANNAFLRLLGQQNNQQPMKVRIVSKRGKRSSQFAEISQENTAIVDELVDLAEKLADSGNGAGAKAIIQIIRKLLANNNKLQQVVSEALQDITG